MSEPSPETKKVIAELFNVHSDFLYNYAITRVNDESLAEDLVQETFVSALKNYQSFKGNSKPSTWLIAILKNKIIDFYRKKVREYHKESLDDLQSTDDFFDEKGHWKKDNLPGPWKSNSMDELDRIEFYEVLQRCLRRLKDIQRIAFVMKHLDDADTEEICKELGITASNYWVIIHRAKLQLRNCLEKNWIHA
jgi:RNA polymerase sigma-70 factor (ECF subfamily)